MAAMAGMRVTLARAPVAAKHEVLAPLSHSFSTLFSSKLPAVSVSQASSKRQSLRIAAEASGSSASAVPSGLPINLKGEQNCNGLLLAVQHVDTHMSAVL